MKLKEVLMAMRGDQVYLSNVHVAELLECPVERIEVLYLLLMLQGRIDCSAEYAITESKGVNTLSELFGGEVLADYYFAAKTVLMFSFYLDSANADYVRHWAVENALEDVESMRKREKQDTEKMFGYLTDMVMISEALENVLDMMQDYVLQRFWILH